MSKSLKICKAELLNGLRLVTAGPTIQLHLHKLLAYPRTWRTVRPTDGSSGCSTQDCGQHEVLTSRIIQLRTLIAMWPLVVMDSVFEGLR